MYSHTLELSVTIALETLSSVNTFMQKISEFGERECESLFCHRAAFQCSSFFCVLIWLHYSSQALFPTLELLAKFSSL